MDFRKIVALDSPVRKFYHYLRGVLAFFLFGNPAKDMIVIGVTGTKGKTTTTNLIAKGLKDAGNKVFMFSTVNYMIGDAISENNLKMTSPSPFVLQRLLRKAKSAGCKFAVIETSSHSIFYNRNYGLDYDEVVLTNISQDHLDLHKTMENYVKVKLKLFDDLVRYRRKPGVKKVSVVNLDSDYSGEFLEATSDIKYTYGLTPSVQVRAQDIRYLKDRTEFSVKMPGNTLNISTKLKGEFNVYNILAAICVLISQKVPPEKIIASIEDTSGIPGRLEEITNNRGMKIFVDYAHTEESLRSVLETIRKMEGIRKIITVFGATGDRDKTKRPKMGKVVDNLSDVIVLTDDDTYTENSLSIINDVSKGIKRKEGEDFWVVADREDAIRTAMVMGGVDDVILVAGKGAENVQVTNNGPIPWSDAAVIRKILREIDENELAI